LKAYRCGNQSVRLKITSRSPAPTLRYEPHTSRVKSAVLLPLVDKDDDQ
jgi:hypothetical protein